jgi:arylsulfatase A-like enzyme
MKNTFCKTILLHLFFVTGPIISQKEQSDVSRPNIIVFLADDMGWQDSSVPFYKEKTKWNTIYHTPNLEKLASQGMKFTNAYAAPVCSPSRVSLLTGMNPVNSKVTNWTMNKNRDTSNKSENVILPKWNMNGLSPVEGIENSIYATTFPSLMKEKGYFNIFIGKAHFGAKDTPGENPLQLGFDVNVGGTAAGQPGSYLGTDNFGNKPGKYNFWGTPGLEKYWGKDIFITEALTQEAIASMDKARESNQPFLLYMANYAVHTPIMEDKRFSQKYSDAGLNPIEVKYASLIEGMDKNLGDIMNYLKENNIEKNTIIIFLSDNGGLSAHSRGGELNTQNTPLRSGKGAAYEGGIRIPFIVKWPDVTKPNTVCENNIIIEDLFPTLLSMSGVKKYDPIQGIDGKSIVPLLKQEAVKNDKLLYWHYPHVWFSDDPALKLYSIVRQGDWKLIYFHEQQRFELYNTKVDIGEQNNLFNTHFNRVKKLANQLGRYLRKAKTEMSIDKKTNKMILYPDEAIRFIKPVISISI